LEPKAYNLKRFLIPNVRHEYAVKKHFTLQSGFRSGFTGFSGFLCLGRWLGECVPQHLSHFSIIQLF
jgi:hypothetical protein